MSAVTVSDQEEFVVGNLRLIHTIATITDGYTLTLPAIREVMGVVVNIATGDTATAITAKAATNVITFAVSSGPATGALVIAIGL